MADLTKSLLKAISIIADKTVEEVSSDKTIKAIIKKSISTSDGKYLVNSESGDYYAYIQPGSKEIYQVGEEVYILIPAAHSKDMSQKKFIIGRTEEGKENFSFETLDSSSLSDYVMLGNNAIIENKYRPEGELYVTKMQPLALNSQEVSDFYYCYLHDPQSIDNNQFIYNTESYPSVDIDEETFSNASKQAEALLIRAKFKSAIDTDIIGNYGIIVNIAFADETNPQTDDEGNVTYPPKLVAYVLDTSKMTGNPMRFYDYTTQYIVMPFNGEKYLYIDSIVAFSEGFVDEPVQELETNDSAYIYIDDIEIAALDEISAVSGDYKLRLSTPKGNTIKINEDNNLSIVATLTCLNQNITQNASFYWGVKDPSITSISDNYNTKLGNGYRYLDSRSNEIILTPADLSAAENIYVCVVDYESEIILKTTVSLYNNNNKLNITIESSQGTDFQFNEGNPILTCLINGKTNNYQDGNPPDDAFSFVWTKEDEEFGSTLLDITEAQLEIDKQKELQEFINDSTITVNSAGRTMAQVLSYYSTREAQVRDISYPNGVHGPQIQCKLKNTNASVTYSCSVYRGGVYAGYQSITLYNHKNIVNNNYYITITNDSQVFQYDESGVAPSSPKQQNPIEVLSLTAVFHSPQGAEVTPKKVRWIMPEDRTLINIPTLGLKIDSNTGERYYPGNIFPLSIKDTYDSNYTNNQLTVIVTHVDGTEYRQSTNLLFTKIGEIGTNGTDTVLKINEPPNIPEDECLTLIKTDEETKYNNGYKSNEAILETSLYTNNTQVLGHNTKWTIAGTSKIQSNKYKVTTDASNNSCIIEYDGINTELDTRIIEAQSSLHGKYYYNFYGMPAIEYEPGYTYEEYPVKIMRDGTLKSILYSSNGINPTYDENQGAHIELGDWDKNGYISWTVESGIKDSNDGIYRNPNLLLSKTSKSKNGSVRLNALENIGEIQSSILETRDAGQFYKNQAPENVKLYIQDFLADIEKIGIDTLLSVPSKLTLLTNRLAAFKNDNVPEAQSNYVEAVYDVYSKLYKQMTDEYESCQSINAGFSETYNKIQEIWSSEWPSVITPERLSVQSNNPYDISTIEELVNAYQTAYDYRSSTSENIDIPARNILFENESGLFDLDSNKTIDSEYVSYLNSHTEEAERANLFHYILVEYSKVLIVYINLLVKETDNYLNNSSNELINKYSSISNNWKNTVGENIFNSIDSSEEIIANVYSYIRNLYKQYQQSYLNITKYQIDEESDTLSAWKAILNGQRVDLLNQIYVVPNETFNGLYMNNNIVGRVYIKEGNTETNIAKVYIPIIMTLNTYELASVNGWDGTAVEVNDDYIMTPQVGAGIKDETTNTFTGMVMGVVGSKTDTSSLSNKANKVGLIGYSNGKQSMFIDSETGQASFGLPEDETNTSEGRIELNPGGVSKIGNWKIGNRFLYNIIDGSYEIRNDQFSRPDVNSSKIMVPHDKYGIILSSDQPYMHIKGKVFEEGSGINYNDEYNEINSGDSLELRLDPTDKSLFSIIQHTTGIGDNNSDLLFGYSDSETNIKEVKNYINETDHGTEYYIYALDKDGDNYEPYYQEWIKIDNDSSDSDLVVFNQDNSFGTAWEILTGTEKLKDSLDINNFKRAFSIDTNGTIYYNSSNLIWKNNDKKGWQLEFSRSTEGINLKYYNKLTSHINRTFQAGTITNYSDNEIYNLFINYNMQCNNNSVEFNSTNYIQFYIRDNNNEIILQSDKLSISNYSNIKVKLSSYEGRSILPNSDENSKTYNLEMKIYSAEYIVNSNQNFKRIQKKSTLEYSLSPVPRYGTASITNFTINETSSTTTSNGSTNVSFSYIFSQDSQQHYLIKIMTNTEQIYDFVIWNNNNILAWGQTVSSKTLTNAKFVSQEEKIWEELSENFNFNTTNLVSPLYVSFYPKDTCVEKIIEYESAIDEEKDEEGNLTGNTISYMKEVLKYTYRNNISKISKWLWDIDWNRTFFDIPYEDWAASWNLVFNEKNVSINSCLIPRDTNKVCVGDKTQENCIQGTPYAKTYWENIDNYTIKKIMLYASYYNYLNSNSNSSSYYYIDVTSKREGTATLYHKAVRSLNKDKVNSWFNLSGNIENLDLEVASSTDRPHPWVKISEALANDTIDWQEFVRVGLDENGRFFTSGTQDKQTYNRTGKLHAFGNMPNLYGNEVRVQSNFSSDINNYIPIIKIFSQNSATNTTYITQGTNDDGNLSLRTAGNNHYVELAASQNSENGGITPDKTSWINVSYNEGIQLKNKYVDNKNEERINTLSIYNDTGISLDSDYISFISGVSEDNENIEQTIHQITKEDTWIKTSDYILSSMNDEKTSAKNKDLNNDYRIRAVKNYINEQNKNEGPRIKFEVGEGDNNTNIDIKTNNISLKSSDKTILYLRDTYNSEGELDHSMCDIYVGEDQEKIGLSLDSSCTYVVDSEDPDQEKTIVQNNIILHNQRSYITLSSNNDTNEGTIEIMTTANDLNNNLQELAVIEVADAVSIRGDKGLRVYNGPGIFTNWSYVQRNLYVNDDVVVGYNTKDESIKSGQIYLCEKEKDEDYAIKLRASDLKQLFDWYNNHRWTIGVSGNTMVFYCVGTSEGQRSKSGNTITFQTKRFYDYITDLSGNEWDTWTDEEI